MFMRILRGTAQHLLTHSLTHPTVNPRHYPAKILAAEVPESMTVTKRRAVNIKTRVMRHGHSD
jgi:hypothetical protein